MLLMPENLNHCGFRVPFRWRFLASVALDDAPGGKVEMWESMLQGASDAFAQTSFLGV